MHSSVPSMPQLSPYSRRDFLGLAAQAGILLAIPGITRAQSPETLSISILHTTDLHGHIMPTEDYEGNLDLGGLARCVTQIRRWQEENPNWILIDVGDVYQGTEFGLRSRGSAMVDLLNLAQFDAWVVGNHEFDWGIEPFWDALQRSTMPVLGANMIFGGRAPGAHADTKHPFARVAPLLMKEFSGIKVAVIGVTTPGMPFWFRPEFIRDLAFPHPVEPVRRAIGQARAAGAHAIVLAGHMGLKDRTGGDDFANTLTSLTHEFPEIAVLIAGHTHQLISSRVHHNALLTQADHFGIHVGRVDLTFDRASKKLLDRKARCQLMDSRLDPDPVIVSRAQPLLDESARTLTQRIGELAQPLSIRNGPGKPSEVEMLIAAAVMEALRQRNVEIDGVLHGLFDEEHPMTAGPKTIEDMWKVLPYENYVVTAELTGEELRETMEEIYEVQRRNLMGFRIETEGKGKNRLIGSMRLEDGRPVEMARRYRVAMNSFDSRSAGHRFMILRELLEMPESRTRLHPVQTREALIDYFRRHKVVRPVRSLRALPAAA